MQGGTVILVEPISGIERQQLDFGSFGQVGGFVNDQPAGLHSSLQCHSDHSSTAQCRATSWPARRIVESRFHHVGDGRRRQAAGTSESLPGCYPSPKRCEIVCKSVRLISVRDRGVGGSNPLAPTTFPRKH